MNSNFHADGLEDFGSSEAFFSIKNDIRKGLIAKWKPNEKRHLFSRFFLVCMIQMFYNIKVSLYLLKLLF